MKIKMLSLMAGPGGTRHPGQVCTVGEDVTAAEAKQLIAGGYAVEVAADASAKPAKGGKGAVPPAPTTEAGAEETTPGN